MIYHHGDLHVRSFGYCLLLLSYTLVRSVRYVYEFAVVAGMHTVIGLYHRCVGRQPRAVSVTDDDRDRNALTLYIYDI